MSNFEREPEANDQPNPTSWLYLRDLNLEVTDGMLHDKFSNFGNIVSIQIFQDFGPASKSTSYAYIKYQNVSDAKRAMDALNSTPLIDKLLQITLSSEEKTVLGGLTWPKVKIKVMGIIIYNLDPSTKSKDIYDTFAPLSHNTPSYIVHKSLTDVSKTLGFLCFGMSHGLDTGLGAKYTAIFFSEEHLVAGESILCQCTTGRLPKKTVMVQNFPETYTEAQLKALFSTYGETTSCHICTDQSGKSFCGGFVSFVDLECAKTACEQLNGTWIGWKKLRLDLLKNIEDYRGLISQEEELLYDKFERRCNAFKTLFMEKSRETDWKDRTSDSIWFVLLAEIRPSLSSDEFEVDCF